jgi:signal transduction histidine kinase
MNKLYSWYYPIVIIIIAFIGAAFTVYTYVKMTSSIKSSLMERADVVAQVLEYDQIASLTGTKEDLTDPNYLSLKERFTKIRALSGDIRSVYLVGYRDDVPFFLVNSEEYSPPGQIYYEAGAGFRKPFLHNDQTKVVEGVYADRWGTWLSALIPIVNSENDRIVAVMGIDMSARTYYKTIFMYSALPVIATIFIIILIIVGHIIRKKERVLLEFKTEFVPIIVHEIRTPLTGISLTAESLLNYSSDNLLQDQKKDIQMIKESCQNLLTMVGSLLDLSSIEEVASEDILKQQVVVLDLLHEIVKNFELCLQEKNIALIFDPSLTNDVVVLADRERFKRMFDNLISNAIKYSKQHSAVTIGCDLNEQNIVFWIKDQGIGIHPKDQVRIFRGFYRTENAKRIEKHGTGLGLRYVKHISELHGGRIWCESKENEGSTFFVALPRH